MKFTSLEGPAMAALRQGREDLKQRAMKEMKLSENDIIIREIRPEDVGLSTPVWTYNIATGTAWNTMIDDKTISDNRFVMISGIVMGESAAGAVTQLRVTRAGQLKRYWQIQDANFYENATLYFSDPIIVDQNTTLKVEGYATAIDTDFRLSFIGLVAEKKGILVV